MEIKIYELLLCTVFLLLGERASGALFGRTGLLNVHKEENKQGICKLERFRAICCLDDNLEQQMPYSTTCGVLTVDPYHLKLNAAIVYDNRVLASQDIVQANKICVPLPPPSPPMTTVCYSIYYIDINPNERKIVSCSAISINNIVRMEFDCLEYSNGRLSISNEHHPYDTALIDVSVNKENPGVTFNIPSATQLIPFA